MAEELPQTDSFGKARDLKLLPIGLFFVGLFVLSIGLGLFFFRGSTPNDDIKIVSSENVSPSGIVVHVDGAVKTPGVYKLSSESRVGDAVSLAGGLTDEADIKRINLAAKVVDGQKLYVAKVGESVSPSFAKATEGKQIAGVSDGPININTSSQKELESLPGIGPVTAAKIIASRPYSDSSELLSRKVVGKSVYEKIRELVTVY